MLLFFSAMKATAQTLPDTTIVATISGTPVCAGEFNMFARQYRAGIINTFLKLCRCEYSANFWRSAAGGISPADSLKKVVLDTLRRIRVQQILAHQYRIDEAFTWQRFLSQLEKENQRRKEAVEQKAVIYGPVKYDEYIYYQYLFRMVVNALKVHLDKDIFRISRDTLDQVYQKKKHELCGTGSRSPEQCIDLIRDRLVEDAYRKYIDTLAGKAELRIIRENLDRISF